MQQRKRRPEKCDGAQVGVDQLLEVCPICNYPYTSGFSGYEYVLTGQSVCGGSQTLKLCLPTRYMCFQIPLSSMVVEVEQKGQKYRGIVYAVNKEEID